MYAGPLKKLCARIHPMHDGIDRKTLSLLEGRIGYTFQDPMLLQRALTHSSYINEHDGVSKDCNERLEFLGDAVLEVASSDALFRAYPDKQEGDLTKHRAELVCEAALSFDARRFDLPTFLLLGKGEEANGGRNRDSIVSDAMEALIGAIYMDGGIDPAFAFVSRFVLDDLEGNRRFVDCKTRLQEMAQEDGHVVSYEVIREDGPPHAREYTVEVYIDGRRVGTGNGSSKKNAQQKAAMAAIEQWKQEGR